MSDGPLAIELDITIDAPPEHAWQMLTASESVPRWLGCLGYEGRLGHVFYMQPDDAKRARGEIEGATHCRVLALDSPRHFAFSWFLPGTPETEVHIQLIAGDEGTRVTLRHLGWSQFDPTQIRAVRDALAGGWKDHVLPALKAACEA